MFNTTGVANIYCNVEIANLHGRSLYPRLNNTISSFARRYKSQIENSKQISLGYVTFAIT